MMRGLIVATMLVAATPVAAGVIGTMTPAEPISEARIATLPATERAAWTAYLARSRALMAADKAALAAERRGLTTIPPSPAHGPSGGGRAAPAKEPAGSAASGRPRFTRSPTSSAVPMR